jgi:hypothetical protein
LTVPPTFSKIWANCFSNLLITLLAYVSLPGYKG